MRNYSKAARAMNVLAYATSKGKEGMAETAMALCHRYGASAEQIDTAIEHGHNVATGIDCPNWKD